MAKRITEKRQRYLELLAAGKDSRAAAREVGFSRSYSEVLATRCRKNPDIAAALEAIREKGRTLAGYDLAAAMKEAVDVIDFAKKNHNSMAYCKAVELRAKLSGLLIDRVEVFTADLRGAIEKAQARVVNPVPQTIPAQKSTYDDAPAVTSQNHEQSHTQSRSMTDKSNHDLPFGLTRQ